jgi:hypothetical protein
MEPLRFGKEHFVDIDELDAELKKQIEQFRQVVPNKQLILVGLSLQSDFERMSLDFPGIIELFSGWVDLSTLMKAQSLAPAKLDTGLGTALKAFRYPYSDTGFNCRHQAANDAVRTLAALHGLMDPQNVASILLRQREFPGIEIAAGVDHFASKVYRALLHVDGKELPPSIDSAQKLALAVQNFKPIGVAADCSNAKNGAKKRHPTSIHTVNRTCGCVCFKSNKALQHFIRVMNGQRYGNVALKAARAPLPQKIQTQISNGKKLNAQRKNRRKQLTRNTDWSGSFRNTFLVHDVTADEEVKQEIAVVETITPYQHQNELPARADGDKEADAEDHVNEVVKEPLDDGTEGVTETAPHTASVVDQVVSFEVEVESQEVSNAAEAETNTEDISTDQHHPDEENAKDTKHLRYSCEESDPVPAHETEVTRNSNKRQRLWPFKHSNSYPKQTRHNGLILDYGTSVPGEKRPSWLSRFRRKVLHIK